MSCSKSIWPIISNINGTISFCSSFISLFPQIIETFRDKTVEGLSPYFLLAWVGGDITSLIGAVLTDQLMFQVVLALYFLVNDLFVCGQYYYYGVLHQNKLATTGHESKPILTDLPSETDRGMASSRRNKKSMLATAFAFVSHFGSSSAFPIKSAMIMLMTADPPVPIPSPNNGDTINKMGRILSWCGAAFYVGARIPQLLKNYQRKSTDGISPFLFATTLLCNVTYNFSILTSCEFIGSDDKRAFIMNALPFLFGSTVTIAFDMIYFYQHYVLYAQDMQLRVLEREQAEEAESAPLLQH